MFGVLGEVHVSCGALVKAKQTQLRHGCCVHPLLLSFSSRFLIVIVLLPSVVAQPTGNICGTKANGRYVCPDCSSTTSTRGASFEANLLRLRDAIHDTAAADTGFLNATFAGGGDAAEDTVYGLAASLADAERANCAACLADVAAELPGTRCAGRRDMMLWYAHCLVGYDNASYFLWF